MAVYFGIDGWKDAAVDVPNPGYGEVDVYLPRVPGRGVETQLRGRDLGRALSDVTTLALSAGLAGRVTRLGSMTVGEARLLLPVLQSAVIYAAAASNAAEVLLDDESDEGPDVDGSEDGLRYTTPRWCITCGEGAIYSTQECRSPGRPDASCVRTDWCDQYGHTWFAGRERHSAAVSTEPAG